MNLVSRALSLGRTSGSSRSPRGWGPRGRGLPFGPPGAWTQGGASYSPAVLGLLARRPTIGVGMTKCIKWGHCAWCSPLLRPPPWGTGSGAPLSRCASAIALRASGGRCVGWCGFCCGAVHAIETRRSSLFPWLPPPLPLSGRAPLPPSPSPSSGPLVLVLVSSVSLVPLLASWAPAPRVPPLGADWRRAAGGPAAVGFPILQVVHRGCTACWSGSRAAATPRRRGRGRGRGAGGARGALRGI